ncbi:MAG: helical backbone metal receptor [bacterium]|nr:helical backbone metal receptor [bacterium]
MFNKTGMAILFLVILFHGDYALAATNYPQRIISLGPGITEELYLLGVGDRIVGVTTYCRRPEEAQKKDKVGTILEVNLEQIMVRKPDLVLALNLTDPRIIERLDGLGIKVHQFPLARNFSELNQQFLDLGRLIGKAEIAQEIVSRARAEVNRISSGLKDLPRPRVFVQVGAKPLFAVNRDYFLNDFIRLAGGINTAEEAGSGGLYSREQVIKDDPDVIIIAAMGLPAEEETRTWEGFKNLRAVQNGRIYIVDSDKYCNPTPLSFVEALREMISLLHPNGGALETRAPEHR